MSAERPEPIWRRITPHAFGYDDFRWHVRAYCHLTDKFKDFLLPRILKSREPGKGGITGEHDRLWQEKFEVEIAPHPELGAGQRTIVERVWSMASRGSRSAMRCSSTCSSGSAFWTLQKKSTRAASI